MRSERQEAKLSPGNVEKEMFLEKSQNGLPQDTKQGSEWERQSIRTARLSAIMAKLSSNGVARSRDRLYLLPVR